MQQTEDSGDDPRLPDRQAGFAGLFADNLDGEKKNAQRNQQLYRTARQPEQAQRGDRQRQAVAGGEGRDNPENLGTGVSKSRPSTNSR